MNIPFFIPVLQRMPTFNLAKKIVFAGLTKLKPLLPQKPYLSATALHSIHFLLKAFTKDIRDKKIRFF